MKVMEEAGLLALVVCSTPFERLAQLTMRGDGVDSTGHLVLVPHPILGATPKQIDEMAAVVSGAVIEAFG
jgi:hypothetical protein